MLERLSLQVTRLLVSIHLSGLVWVSCLPGNIVARKTVLMIVHIDPAV